MWRAKGRLARTPGPGKQHNGEVPGFPLRLIYTGLDAGQASNLVMPTDTLKSSLLSVAKGQERGSLAGWKNFRQ